MHYNMIIYSTMQYPRHPFNRNVAVNSPSHGQRKHPRGSAPRSLAAFLSSEDSRYIQDAAIVADGGWTISAT